MTQTDILDNLVINKGSKKCFVFDLDGTIIFKNRLDLVYENILQKIIDYGHEVIFATGRSYRDFKTIMPERFHMNKMTLFNGSLSRGDDGVICRNIYLPRICVETIAQLCLKHKSPFIMDNISHYYHPLMEGATFGFVDSLVADYQIKNLEHMLETDIYKILIFDMQQHGLFTEYAADNDLAIKHHSYDDCFDVVVSGCNKYDGILPLLKDYSIDDIFVFGNDFNDYEMLLNFPNSILLGEIPELQQIAKLNIVYDAAQENNFNVLIDTILIS